jgi:hypothetical protein
LSATKVNGDAFAASTGGRDGDLALADRLLSPPTPHPKGSGGNDPLLDDLLAALAPLALVELGPQPRKRMPGVAEPNGSAPGLPQAVPAHLDLLSRVADKPATPLDPVSPPAPIRYVLPI